jgi:quercetin dioxygenase-like cupin family protein
MTVIHRGGYMIITNLQKIRKVKVEMEGAKNAFKQVPLSREDGAPHFSFRVFTLEPRGHTPFHSHPFEHLNYIIAGKGAMIRENGSEEPIQKGDFMMVLPGERHQYRNLSENEQLQFICAVPVEHE